MYPPQPSEVLSGGIKEVNMMIQIKRKSSKSAAVKAGIAGAVIGAAGTAIGMSMRDKKNRDKVKNTLSDAKKWTKDTVDSIQEEVRSTAKSVKDEAKKTVPASKQEQKKSDTRKKE